MQTTSPYKPYSTAVSPLKQQLQWLLLLRVILYTLLLGINFFFHSGGFEIIVLPVAQMVFFISIVYITSIVSSLYLNRMVKGFVNFGLLQTILDTLFVSSLVFWTGSSHSIFTTVYFFPIVSAGLILPNRGGFLAAATSTLLFGGILWLESMDIYPSSLRQYDFMNIHDFQGAVNVFGVKGVTFFIAALLSSLFGRRLLKAETALSHTKKSYKRLNVLYKLVFDNISTGILTIDHKNRITSANSAFEHITGYKEEELLNQQIPYIFPTLQLSVENQRLADTLEKKDGRQIRVGYSLSCFYSDEHEKQSELPHKVITLQDIGEVELLEKKMRQAEKLAAIGMMSASIAHDFRNPLTAISGSAQVLALEYTKRRTESEKNNHELTTIIVRESKRLTDTITNFLRFARPEEIKKEWFSLQICIAEVIQIIQKVHPDINPANIVTDFNENLDIWGDPKQLNIVFTELINNSISFCPPGEEQIFIEAFEQKNKEPNIIQICFQDNGKGFPVSEGKMIFEPFFTTRTDGTGLGLAIIKQTIEEHGGSISTGISQLGGAQVTISLPLP